MLLLFLDAYVYYVCTFVAVNEFEDYGSRIGAQKGNCAMLAPVIGSSQLISSHLCCCSFIEAR